MPQFVFSQVLTKQHSAQSSRRTLCGSLGLSLCGALSPPVLSLELWCPWPLGLLGLSLQLSKTTQLLASLPLHHGLGILLRHKLGAVIGLDFVSCLSALALLHCVIIKVMKIIVSLVFYHVLVISYRRVNLVPVFPGLSEMEVSSL